MTNDRKLSAPWFLRWTGGLLHETPENADTKAEMLALFLCAGSTVLGTIVGASLLVRFAPPNHPGAAWIAGLLASAAVGAACGYFLSAALLGLRSVIRFERRTAAQRPGR